MEPHAHVDAVHDMHRFVLLVIANKIFELVAVVLLG